MYITFPMNNKQFKIENIYFSERQKNIIIDNCYFSNILYSTNHFTLQNIVFKGKIHVDKVEYKSNYSICYYSTFQDILFLKHIEEKLLLLYQNTNLTKNMKFNLYNLLKKKFIRLSTTDIHPGEHTIYIRISGIWQDINNNIGLIYKFII